MNRQGVLQDHEFAPVLAKCWRPFVGKYYDWSAQRPEAPIGSGVTAAKPRPWPAAGNFSVYTRSPA
ncbi:hypothetical protein J2Z70_005330 [Paenibacillus silagei]|uniref:Uncharacterized protein n=1 Tax=Paenibacillus silagei TaxID=1670801 RepID=A0ABS4NYJ3_9BACL|nr:hypothetical protein [Paenibacillus silagei]